MDCIDGGLDQFGLTVKMVIYHRLQTTHDLQKKDVPRKPEIFSNAVREIFGIGSAVIEEKIVSSIVDGLHPKNVKKTDSLIHAITEARRELMHGRI